MEKKLLSPILHETGLLIGLFLCFIYITSAIHWLTQILFRLNFQKYGDRKSNNIYCI